MMGVLQGRALGENARDPNLRGLSGYPGLLYPSFVRVRVRSFVRCTLIYEGDILISLYN